MERSERICMIIEQLHEELDAETNDLKPLARAAVLRSLAELALTMVDREAVLIQKYLLDIYGENEEVREAVSNIRLHAHRIRNSGEVRAVRIFNGMNEEDVAAVG